MNAKTPTRERILAEARKIFAGKGFEAASMHEIARHVGIEKPSLYYFFKNKEQLFGAMVEETWQGLATDLKDFRKKSRNPKESLRLALNHLIKISSRIGLAILQMDKQHHKYCEGAMKHIMGLRKNLREFLEEHKIPHPQYAEMFIVNAVRGYMVQCQLNEPQVTIETYSKYLVDLIFSSKK